jgi:hypothetical protein
VAKGLPDKVLYVEHDMMGHTEAVKLLRDNGAKVETASDRSAACYMEFHNFDFGRAWPRRYPHRLSREAFTA